MTRGIEALMSEKQLLGCVRKLAQGLGYLTYHTHNSQRSEPGFPDLVITPLKGKKPTIFAELKDQKGVVSDDQLKWMQALKNSGEEVYLWRPAQWLDGTIEEILR